MPPIFSTYNETKGGEIILIGAKLIIRLIDWIIAIIEVLLGLRLVLKLFGANPDTPFVNFVYETTQPLLAPFVGIFPSQTIDPGNVLEVTTLFAIIVYAVLGYLLEELVASVAAGSKRVIEEAEEEDLE